jgi:hypothetical protein
MLNSSPLMMDYAPVAELGELLRDHMEMPFPASVEKGVDYGLVDPVMIGADIYGWATRIEGGNVLDPVDRDRLAAARDELLASLGEFPADARPYYELVLKIANEALR